MLHSYVALVRGINVGGKKLVAMSDLKQLFVREGFTSPRTLLQSGNVVFAAKASSIPAVAKKLEVAAEKQFGHTLHFVLRSGKQWREIIDTNPLSKEATDDPAHVVAMCLQKSPGLKAMGALRGAIVGREAAHAIGDTLYVHYPDGIGTSRLTHALIERTLDTVGTARNWNTVLKISAAIDAL